jgi:DNA-directed RNA polymerase subunit K/omega
MSDNEDDYSVTIGDGGSDGESENYKKPSIIKNKKVNARPTISDYDDDDDDDENEDIHGGGNDDDDEDDETKLDENQEDDDEYDAGNENVVDDEDDDEDLYEDDEDDEDDDDDDDDDDNDDDHDDDEMGNKTKSGGAKTTKNKGKQVKSDKKQTTIQLDTQINDYDDDDDDDYQDDNYLQKFDKEITKDYIMDFHPECLNHNYDEIKSLSKVTRDEFNIIIDPLHKTVPFLTKYEKARILGQRAKQIECGAKPLVKVPENIIDSYLIAELELEQKAIPFIIRRPIPSGGSEYWNLKDLEVISF